MKIKKRVYLYLSLLLVAIFAAFAIFAFADGADFVPKMSVSMSDSLAVNIYIPKDESIVSLSLNGEEQKIDKLPVSDGYYLLQVSNVACEADAEIKLSVKLSNEAEEREYTFSLAKYAKEILSSGESDTAKKLALDILLYVNAAKEYFFGNPSTEIEDVLSDYEGEEYDGVEISKVEVFSGASFALKSKPEVRFYLPEGASASDFTIRQGNEVIESYTGRDKYGDYIAVSVSPHNITEDFLYTVSGDESVYSYSFLNYIYYVKNDYQGNDKAALLALSSAFYAYCESAFEYLREDIISKCNHSYKGEVIKKASALEEGIMKNVCEKCGNEYEEAIPTSIKILAVGNSFSVDAMEHLYLILKDAGVENILLGNLYIGGCRIERHYNNMMNDIGDYTFYISDDEKGGMITEGTGRSAKYGITYADWDYITVQQGSDHSGLAEKFSDLQGVLDYINENKTSEAKLFWHMTWAYQQDSSHSGFKNYNSNQLTMYNSIIGVVKEVVLKNGDIAGLIPSGTAVQNLRTSELGDTLTRDGYHLSMGIGRYTAALTWLGAITGYDIEKITKTPASYPEVADNLDMIKDAVKKALASPLEITNSAYPAPDKLMDASLSPLTADDVSYLTSKGFAADDYMLLDLSFKYNAYYNSNTGFSAYSAGTTSTHYNKFIATQQFTRSELITGSIIRINSGYQYRPDGWITPSTKNTNDTRPGNVSSDAVVVNDDWWGSFTYRGFNISRKSGTITESESDNFKIYIPIVKRTALTAQDIEYLKSMGLNPDEYMVLDFDYTLDAHYNSAQKGAIVTPSEGNVKYKYVATEVFSRYDLTIGSIIRITGENHKYRPEGWDKYTSKNATARPTQTDKTVTVVNSSWWGTYLYRAFNILDNEADAQNPVTDADAAAIRIYIKLN